MGPDATIRNRARRLSMLTLGTCSVAAEGKVVEGVPANFYRIAVYLALSVRHHSATRQRLRNLLWPDLDQENSSADLRQCLARIRQLQQTHGFELIQSNYSSVFLNPQCDIDWDLPKFLDSIEHDTPRSFLDSCELYRGDLLAGLPGSSHDFEDWLVQQRERLRNLYIDKMSETMDEAEALPEDALCMSLDHLLSIDPCNERGYRLLMRHAAKKRDMRKLQRLHEKCKRKLREELDIGMSEDTHRLWLDLSRKLTADSSSDAANLN